nr:MAG TPA: hypothetical protein [Caudoviricetes sp.]
MYTNLDREIYLTQKLQEICQLHPKAKIKTFHYEVQSTIWVITDIPDNPTGDFIRLNFKDLLEKTFHAGHTHKKLQWEDPEMTRQVTYSYGRHKGIEEVLIFRYHQDGQILYITWTHSKD